MTTALFFLGKRRGGRKPLFGTRATRRVEICVTEEHYNDLKRIASDERTSITHVVRSAVDEFVGDYREKVVFGGAPTRYEPKPD